MYDQNMQPVNTNPVPTMPLTPPAPMRPPKNNGSIVKTIVIIILSLTSIAFIGLCIYLYTQLTAVQTDVQGQIDLAVAAAEKDVKQQAEEAYQAELDRTTYTFAGPSDYGELTFEYPKHWSVYIKSDASKGGDFEAYLNPGQVNPVSASTINALRVSILGKSYDSVLEKYSNDVKKGTITVNSININGQPATYYTGQLTKDIVGAVAIFKIRDKTAVLQTDAQLFVENLQAILSTVKYNL